MASTLFFLFLTDFRILGVDRLLNNIITEWGNDIKRNQIPQIVGGVGPLHSLRQLSTYTLILASFQTLIIEPLEIV